MVTPKNSSSVQYLATVFNGTENRRSLSVDEILESSSVEILEQEPLTPTK